MVWITVALTAITALMFLINVYQARNGRQASMAGIMFQFLEQYSNTEMLVSLAELRRFRAENSELLSDLTCLYKCIYQDAELSEKVIESAQAYVNKHETAVGCEGISEHRAKVAWFFSKAWRLRKYKFIDEKTMRTICSLDGAGAFLDVACPLTLAIRFVKIHNLDVRAFRLDPNVQWYRDVDRLHDAERPDLKHRY